MLVRHWIASSLAGGDPTVARAAEAAGMSVRTLQRRLMDFGLTYRQLLDEVRLEMACGLMERSEANLAETAVALGYSDPAHFTRAFERWTGEAPSAFRHRIRQAHRRGP